MNFNKCCITKTKNNKKGKYKKFKSDKIEILQAYYDKVNAV